MLVQPEFEEAWKYVYQKDGLKTFGDLQLDKVLKQRLSKLTPDIKIYSEEDNHFLSERQNTYWLVDPIDGTASWINGFDGFVTQVALIENNRPIYGGIYWPTKKILWHAIHSVGVYRNGQMMLPISNNNDPLIVIDNNPTPNSICQKILNKSNNACYRECGSLGLKTILVLEGSADILIKKTKFRDWDLAPAMAFLEFLPGTIVNLRYESIPLGESIEFRDGLLVCCHKGVLEFVRSLFP